MDTDEATRRSEAELDPLKFPKENVLWKQAPIREVRFGVTMVGGTSLAIYENGVAQELCHAVRGRGVYGLLKKLTKSHVLVDLLSGTSAGGINNIFLAAALATNGDLSVTKEIWREGAGIGDLMQDPADQAATTLFQGNTYYFGVLEKGFKAVYRVKYDYDAAEHVPSPFYYRPDKERRVYGPGEQHLDLLVTGTFYEGMPYTFYDSRNQPIDTRNYRGVFHLKHRPQRTDPSRTAGPEPSAAGESHFHEERAEPKGFSRTSNAASDAQDFIVRRLTRIARTTSSLPAVFEPSCVEPSEMGSVIDLPRKSQHSFVVDGGYLNNRPIDLMLDAIQGRSAGREVVRKLILVEPRPDRPEIAPEVPPCPNAIQNLLFYLRIPNYQSLKSALEQIEQHNRRVRRVNDVLARVKDELTEGGAEESTLSPRQRAIWASLRLDLMATHLRELWHEARQAGYRAEQHIDMTDDQRETLRRQTWKEAVALRAIEPALRKLFADEFTAAAAAARGFPLDRIDTHVTRRKAERLIRDLRDSLYPPRGKGSADLRLHIRDTLQSKTALPGLRARDENYWETLNHTMGRWHRFVDLLNMIEVAVGEVCQTVAGLAVYENAKQAALAAYQIDPSGQTSTVELARAVEALWNVLRDAVLDLVTPPADQAEDLLSRLRSRGVSPPTIQQSDLNHFEKYLDEQSKKVCAALENKDAKPARPEIPGRQTLIQAVSDALDRQAAWAANELQPIYEAAKKAHQAEEAATGEKRPAPTFPLEWAARPAGGSEDVWIKSVRDRSERVDAYLFPIENMSDLRSRSPIELVRISPYDAQDEYSDGEPEHKVAGDKLGNLSGFFKRSWRANDILFGRLDAADALVSTLLERDRLSDLVAFEKLGQAGAGGDVAAEKKDPLDRAGKAFQAAVFGNPNGAGAASDGGDRIGRFLNESFKKDPRFQGDFSATDGWPVGRWLDELANPATSERSRKKLHALLLTRLQLEILCEEVPEALAEEESERKEWAARDEDDGKGALLAPQGSRKSDDPLIPQTPGETTRARWRQAAKDRAHRFFDGDPGRVDAFFRNGYRVGQETIAGDLPPQVLLRLGLGLILTFLHILQNLMQGSKAQGSGPMRALASWVLRPLTLLIGVLYGFFNAVTKGEIVAVALQAMLWTVGLGLGAIWVLRVFGVPVGPEWNGYLPLALAALLLLLGYGTLRGRFGQVAGVASLLCALVSFGLAGIYVSLGMDLAPWYFPWAGIGFAAAAFTLILLRSRFPYPCRAWMALYLGAVVFGAFWLTSQIAGPVQARREAERQQAREASRSAEAALVSSLRAALADPGDAAPAAAASPDRKPVPRYLWYTLAWAGAFLLLASGASLLAAAFSWLRRDERRTPRLVAAVAALALLAGSVVLLTRSGALRVEDGEVRLRYRGG